MKYLVKPDYIYSKHDGDRHLISGRELIRLYGVDPKNCKIAPFEHTDYIQDELEDRMVAQKGLIVLRPRYQGDYREWLAIREGRIVKEKMETL